MRPTLLNLQALRGAACLLVVATHVAAWEATFGLSFSPARPLLYVGHFAIDVFFVISGFILTHAHLDKPVKGTLSTYLWRRAWRVYPTYWVALALAIGVNAALIGSAAFGPNWPIDLLSMALLLPQEPYPVWLPVVWTMVYEVMFYLAFGLLLFAPRKLAIGVVVVWTAAVVVRAIVGWEPGLYLGTVFSPYLLEFLAGALAAYAAGRTRAYPATAAGLGLVWLVVGAMLIVNPTDPLAAFTDARPRVLAFGPPAALLIYAAAVWERSGWRAPRWLVWFGDRSYSIYLLHAITNPAVVFLTMRAEWSHSRTWHVVWLGFVFWCGVGAGAAFYWLVEARVMNVVKKKKPASVPLAEAVVPPLRSAA